MLSSSSQYKTQEELQVLRNIQKNLEQIVQDHDQIDTHYVNVVNRVPGCLMFLTKQMMEVMDKLDHATMSIDKFRNKAVFRTNQPYMRSIQPVEGTNIDGTQKQNPISNDNSDKIPQGYQNYDPLVYPLKHPKVGEFEQAIIEQIECVDAQRNRGQSENYEQFNEMLANRIYYTNEAVDLCLKNLLKKL